MKQNHPHRLDSSARADCILATISTVDINVLYMFSQGLFPITEGGMVSTPRDLLELMRAVIGRCI